MKEMYVHIIFNLGRLIIPGIVLKLPSMRRRHNYDSDVDVVPRQIETMLLLRHKMDILF